MGAYFLFAAIVAALPRSAFSGANFRNAMPRAPRAILAVASGLLLCLSALASYGVFALAVGERAGSADFVALPLHFLAIERVSAARADQLLGLTVLESLALLGLLAGLDGLGARRRIALVGGVAIVLATGALASRAIGSSDPYLYVGIARLGLHAYQPPDVSFPGDEIAVNRIWGTPLFPCAYGPVWVALSAFALAPFHTLAAKLLALRAIGLGSLATCALLVRRLGGSRTIVAAILCNPALYSAYVADAHNDLVAVDAALAALLFARASLGASFACALVATFVKLTLAPVVLVALTGVASLRSRFVYALGLAACALVAYASFGGVMWDALRAAAAAHAHPAGPLDVALRAVALTFGLGTAALAVIAGRTRPQAAWSLPALGDYPLSWYFIWGLPLAILDEPVAVTYLATLPLVAFFRSSVVPATPLTALANGVAIALAVGIVAVRVGRVRLAASAPLPGSSSSVR